MAGSSDIFIMYRPYIKCLRPTKRTWNQKLYYHNEMGNVVLYIKPFLSLQLFCFADASTSEFLLFANASASHIHMLLSAQALIRPFARCLHFGNPHMCSLSLFFRHSLHLELQGFLLIAMAAVPTSLNETGFVRNMSSPPRCFQFTLDESLLPHV